MNTHRSITPRGLASALALTLVASAGLGATSAAVDFDASAGPGIRTGSLWLAPDDPAFVTVLKRPLYVDALVTADRAERIIVSELERRRELSERLAPRIAVRFDRVVSGR